MDGPDAGHIQVSPLRALAYGGGLIRITFPERQPLLGDQYVLTLEGQRQRHVCSCRISSRYTLEATIPEHRSCEVVQLCILENTRGVLSFRHRGNFSFLYDAAYHIAIYCLNSVYDPDALENCDHIRTEHFTLADEAYDLDDRLTRAFKYLDIPEGWNILGLDNTLPDPPPRETLLHFAARCGLEHFAIHLLSFPGSQRALVLPNRFRELPVHIAQQRRYRSMVDLLSPHNKRRHSIGLRPQTKPGKVPVKVNRHGEGMASVTTDLRRSSSSLESEIAVLQSVLSRMTTLGSSEEIDNWLYRPRATPEGSIHANHEEEEEDEAFHPAQPPQQEADQQQQQQYKYRRHSAPKKSSSYHQQRHYRKNMGQGRSSSQSSKGSTHKDAAPPKKKKVPTATLR